MSATTELKLDLTEEFPHLPRAPIVEAAVEVRTRAQGAWEEAAITEQVKSRLPEYPKVQSHTRFVQEITYAVILDIDVFTLHSFQLRESILGERLPEMRWLKNKVFFGSVTPKALESFK